MNKYFVISQRGLYWRPYSSGYTNNICLAGIYSKQQATSIVNNKRDPPNYMTDLQSEKLIGEIKREILEAEKIIEMGLEKLKVLKIL